MRFTDGFNSEEFEKKKIGFYLCIASLVFMYCRIQEQLFFLKPIKAAGLVSLAAIVWSLLHFKQYLFKERQIQYLFAFILVAAISSIGAVHASAYYLVFQWTVELFPLVCLVVLTVCTVQRFYTFFIAWCLINLFIGVIVLKNGGTGTGDFIGDENDTALTVGMALPIVYYISFWPNISSKLKWLARGTFVLLTVGIIISQSRGGFLGLASVYGMLWLFMKRRTTVLFSSILIIIISSSVIYSMLPDGYIDDLASGFTDPEDNTRVERLRSWEISWIAFKDNFIIGTGPGSFPWIAGNYQTLTSWWEPGAKSLQGRQVHSMYFEILSDLGVLGVFIYYSLIFGTMAKLSKIAKSSLSTKNKKIQPTEDQIRTAMIARALFISAICFLISGAFISVTYYPHIAIWTAFCVITIRQHRNLNGTQKAK